MGLATAGTFSQQTECSLLQKKGLFFKNRPTTEGRNVEEKRERGETGEKESKTYPKHTRRTKIEAESVASERETHRRDVGGETDSVRGSQRN